MTASADPNGAFQAGTADSISIEASGTSIAAQGVSERKMASDPSAAESIWEWPNTAYLPGAAAALANLIAAESDVALSAADELAAASAAIDLVREHGQMHGYTEADMIAARAVRRVLDAHPVWQDIPAPGLADDQTDPTSAPAEELSGMARRNAESRRFDYTDAEALESVVFDRLVDRGWDIPAASTAAADYVTGRRGDIPAPGDYTPELIADAVNQAASSAVGPMDSLEPDLRPDRVHPRPGWDDTVVLEAGFAGATITVQRSDDGPDSQPEYCFLATGPAGKGPLRDVDTTGMGMIAAGDRSPRPGRAQVYAELGADVRHHLVGLADAVAAHRQALAVKESQRAAATMTPIEATRPGRERAL